MKEEKELKIEVFLFRNGNSVVLRNEEQVPELQKSWIVLFAEHLESKGIDPTMVKFYISDGYVRMFKTHTGYNWQITEGGL